MSFDPTAYAQLQAIDPAAAAAYLASTTASPATPAPATTPPPAATAQAQPDVNQALNQAQAAQPAAARATTEDFYNQPTGGGKSVTSKFFNKRQQGSWLKMQVLADVNHSDVQHQKTPQGVLQYFKKNGQDDPTRPKLVLVVKVLITGSSDGTHVTEFPDGQGTIWLKKGPVTDELIRAMSATGDPSGLPKRGASIVMISNGEQPSSTAGYSATKLYKFDYAPADRTQEDLQAVAQQASGFATADPTVLAESATATSAVATTTPVTPAPTAAASAVGQPGTAVAPTSEVTPPPAAGDKASLLAKLQGANAA